ncbi:MAG: DUF6226 family protein [Nitriliruptoraceae bacterium]
MSANDEPPPEAYGRVSEPERYRVLHSAASRLVQDLVGDFDVVVHEGVALDPELARMVEAERSVKLAPVSPAAAPIAIALTLFPGVYVQFGRWEARSYPSCGCDACDEGPAELVHQLRRDVKAVADGNFREELRGGLRPRRAVELWGDGWRSSHHGAMKRREMQRLGPPGSHAWRPWPRRAPG